MRIKTLLERTIVLMFAIFLFYGCDREETYIVSFDANGGTGRMQSQLFDAGVPQVLTQNLYNRDGYTFSGWNTMQTGNGTAYTNGQTITVTSDMTLYAQWTNNGISGGGQSGSGTHTGDNGVLNGHEYVDLGLPSGTLWATCNVGANSPEEYGDYFAWGETSPKEYYNGNTSTYTGNSTTLSPSDDAAAVNWGSGWRMPTYEEIKELYNNCTSGWAPLNGINGRWFTGPNGNSIFMPAAGAGRYNEFQDLCSNCDYGYYWSNSIGPDGIWYLGIDLNFCGLYCNIGSAGFTVRPVCRQTNNGVLNGYNYVDLGLPSGTKWATCNVGATICPFGFIIRKS